MLPLKKELEVMPKSYVKELKAILREYTAYLKQHPDNAFVRGRVNDINSALQEYKSLHKYRQPGDF